MSRDPAYITALKRLSRESIGVFDALIGPEYLKIAEDRPAVIIVTSHLEDSLRSLILTEMIPLNNTELGELFSSDRPLSTFSSKIHFAYALGLIGKNTRADLELIKLVRNTFAHARRLITFDTQEVADVCDHITLPDRYDLSHWRNIELPLDSPRKRFMATVKLYDSRMTELGYGPLIEGDTKPPVPLD